MDYTDFYYNHIVGYSPSSEESYKQTKSTINHLIDNGVEGSSILKFLEEVETKEMLLPSDLPDWLWEGSLLIRDTFYYHKTLHLVPAAPVFNPHTRQETVEDFYMEMRIRFTAEDLMQYYYKTLRAPLELIDKKRDEGSFNYLIKKYSQVKIVEPIDFVLSLIDYAKYHMSFAGPTILGLADYENEVLMELKRTVPEAAIRKANCIKWR